MCLSKKEFQLINWVHATKKNIFELCDKQQNNHTAHKASPHGHDQRIRRLFIKLKLRVLCAVGKFIILKSTLQMTPLATPTSGQPTGSHGWRVALTALSAPRVEAAVLILSIWKVIEVDSVEPSTFARLQSVLAVFKLQTLAIRQGNTV